MKAVLTGLWVLLLFLSCLFLSIPVVKADLIGFDGVIEAHKPYIVSPLDNSTYANPLTLDVHFYAEVWGNINFTMVYSLDGQMNESVPLVDHYVSFLTGHHNESYVDGSISLPLLSEGSHTITVYLESAHEVGLSTGSETFHYFDSETVSFIVENINQSNQTPIQPNPISATPQQENTTEPIQSNPPNSGSGYLVTPIIVGTCLIVAVILVYLRKSKRLG